MNIKPLFAVSMITFSSFFLISCATTQQSSSHNYFEENYASRLSPHIQTHEKVVIVNPNVHAWGAYDRDGNLIRAGIATAGGAICPTDADEADCRTGQGVFRVTALGDGGCYSHIYPRPHGGGLMPYCMYFNHGQALHGSPDDIVVEQNVSHGCVRMRIPDAEWMRYNFASVGMKVVVMHYDN